MAGNLQDYLEKALDDPYYRKRKNEQEDYLTVSKDAVRQAQRIGKDIASTAKANSNNASRWTGVLDHLSAELDKLVRQVRKDVLLKAPKPKK